jgi:hypothetical protein
VYVNNTAAVSQQRCARHRTSLQFYRLQDYSLTGRWRAPDSAGGGGGEPGHKPANVVGATRTFYDLTTLGFGLVC